MIRWLIVLAAVGRVWALERRLELVARAEHELRGPMTSLMLALPRGARVDGELARVRVGLADLAAARTGRRAATRARAVALDELAAASAAGWNGRGGRRVSVDWAAGPAVVRADPARLSQALGNLLANAVEHGRGPVQLRARRVGDRVRVEVTDTGPGVGAARRLPLHVRMRTRAGGRGRGLAIARAAVADAGGELRIERHPVVDLPVSE